MRTSRSLVQQGLLAVAAVTTLLVIEGNFTSPTARSSLQAGDLSVELSEVRFRGSLVESAVEDEFGIRVTLQEIQPVEVRHASGKSTYLPAAAWFDELGKVQVEDYFAFELVGTEEMAFRIPEVTSISYSCCGDDSQLILTLGASGQFQLPQSGNVEIRTTVDPSRLGCSFESPKFFCPFASMRRSSGRGVAIRDSFLVAADFSDNDLRHAVFNNVDLRGAVFVDADLTGALFRDCDLRGAVFEGSRQQHLLLSGSQTEGAQGLFSGSGAPRWP